MSCRQKLTELKLLVHYLLLETSFDDGKVKFHLPICYSSLHLYDHSFSFLQNFSHPNEHLEAASISSNEHAQFFSTALMMMMKPEASIEARLWLFLILNVILGLPDDFGFYPNLKVVIKARDDCVH